MYNCRVLLLQHIIQTWIPNLLNFSRLVVFLQVIQMNFKLFTFYVANHLKVVSISCEFPWVWNTYLSSAVQNKSGRVWHVKIMSFSSKSPYSSFEINKFMFYILSASSSCQKLDVISIILFLNCFENTNLPTIRCLQTHFKELFFLFSLQGKIYQRASRG